MHLNHWIKSFREGEGKRCKKEYNSTGSVSEGMHVEMG